MTSAPFLNYPNSRAPKPPAPCDWASSEGGDRSIEERQGKGSKGIGSESGHRGFLNLQKLWKAGSKRTTMTDNTPLLTELDGAEMVMGLDTLDGTEVVTSAFSMVYGVLCCRTCSGACFACICFLKNASPAGKHHSRTYSSAACRRGSASLSLWGLQHNG